jgi:bromodomain-containing factor 1
MKQDGHVTKISDTEQTFCYFAHRKLCRESNPYNIPFLHPGYPEGMGIPHYREIFKEPMDLSTVGLLLDAGFYATIDAFEADVRRIFRNCYLVYVAFTPGYNLVRSLKRLLTNYGLLETPGLMK